MAIDRFANIATILVTASGANTLTFQELRTQVGIESDRKSAQAMIVDEIDYMPNPGALNEMTVAADRIDFALTISNAVTDLNDITDRRILHSGYFLRTDFGTAAAAALQKMPFVFQFFPPLITAERSLFLAVNSVGLASAAQMRARIYHRIVRVSQSEFLELAEVFRLVG